MFLNVVLGVIRGRAVVLTVLHGDLQGRLRGRRSSGVATPLHVVVPHGLQALVHVTQTLPTGVDVARTHWDGTEITSHNKLYQN